MAPTIFRLKATKFSFVWIDKNCINEHKEFSSLLHPLAIFDEGTPLFIQNLLHIHEMSRLVSWFEKHHCLFECLQLWRQIPRVLSPLSCSNKFHKIFSFKYDFASFRNYKKGTSTQENHGKMSVQGMSRSKTLFKKSCWRPPWQKWKDGYAISRRLWKKGKQFEHTKWWVMQCNIACCCAGMHKLYWFF